MLKGHWSLRTSCFMTNPLAKSHLLRGIVLGLCLLSTLPAPFANGQAEAIRARIEPREVERFQRGLRDLEGLSPREFDEVQRRFQGDVWRPREKAEKSLAVKLNQFRAFDPLLPQRPETKIDLSPEPPQRNRPQYVRWVQESLNRTIGAKLSVDGALTQQTRDAIKEFQRRNGLGPDGIVSSKTESKLVEVTNTRPPGSWFDAPVQFDPLDQLGSTHPVRPASSPWRDYLLKNLATSVHRSAPESHRQVVFVDVKKRMFGLTSVVVHSVPDIWFQQAGLSELSLPTARYVSSPAQLEELLGGATTVILRGDDLPPGWQDHLQENREYLRASDRSPKELTDYKDAAELLDHRAEVGKTRILSALPQARGTNDLVRELARMDLRTDEAERWHMLREDLDSVNAQSGVKIEPVTKAAFIAALSSGANDFVVLIAHFADGKLHFPGGETMAVDDLAAFQRKQAPNRAVVLVSCSAGNVNSPEVSPAEKLLGGKMAQMVIAHPDPISALQVPELLREFLIEHKKIRDVFGRRGYRFIAEYLLPEGEAGKSVIAPGQEEESALQLEGLAS